MLRDVTLIHALRLGLNDVRNTPGWALPDSATAAAYGAPLGFRSGPPLDFFVPDESVVRRAINLLGTAQSASQARATIRVAPVPSIVRATLSTRRRVPLSGPSRTHCSSRWISHRTSAAGGRSSRPGPTTAVGPVSGNRVVFVGDAMAAVVQGVIEVRSLVGRPPVIVGASPCCRGCRIPTAPPSSSTWWTACSARRHNARCYVRRTAPNRSSPRRFCCRHRTAR